MRLILIFFIIDDLIVMSRADIYISNLDFVFVFVVIAFLFFYFIKVLNIPTTKGKDNSWFAEHWLFVEVAPIPMIPF